MSCALMGVYDQKVDPKLNPYFIYYKDLISTYCEHPEETNQAKTYEIIFSPREKGIIATCTRLVYGFRIEFDPDWFFALSSPEIYQIMMHELSHCLIYKNHVDDENNYMNDTLEKRIPIEVTREQVIQDIKEVCNK